VCEDGVDKHMDVAVTKQVGGSFDNASLACR
jgi:hypothetical protein